MPAASEISSATEYRAWFQCIAGCAGQYSLKDIIYRCPQCGNLLEVEHDLQRLRQHPPTFWKELFDRRFLRNEWPYGSSVWGKREMVCPDVENRNVVSTFEGGSNLFWAERLGRAIGVSDLWIKHWLVQRSGHDRLGLHGAADDGRRSGDPGGGVCFHGGYLGIVGSILCRGRHAGDCLLAQK
jgi:hypothetical protein